MTRWQYAWLRDDPQQLNVFSLSLSLKAVAATWIVWIQLVTLVQLLQDEPRRRRMGEAGRARATEKFSVERMVETTLAAYGRIPPRS